ncbi:uncharacterized protein LOC112088194 [Eutrema salsugineum]|uniref:uncharacterized protein LOC112088194 n=1 Tax=Eutrema salsugineum TaxID=72664 RepID=UPI000CECF316|nr:uncharacterized protein LOC112088194 [Eutrema salsugineum]
MNEMRVRLQAMTSLVHQVTSSAPEIDRVLKESQSTPFTTRITDFPIRNQVKFNLPTYTGNSDPSQYMTVFSIQMGRARFTPKEKDAGFCQLFVENLSGAALVWFSKLKANSIDSYQALSTAFLKRYMMYIQGAVSSADLFQIKQVIDEASISALRNALRFDTKFQDTLKFGAQQTLEDALHRATLYIEDEEEKEIASPAKATPRQQPPKETPKRGTAYNINAQQQNSQYQPQSNTWQRGDYGETRPFCDYDNKYGHPIVMCRELHAYLLAKYRKGEIALANQPQSATPHNNETRPPVPVEQLPPPPPTSEQANDDLTKRDREVDAEGVDMPHNDLLVIELRIADCEVSRILIDTGSSVDLIFKETLDKMELANHHLKASVKPLTGFDGDTVYSIGTIRLPVYAMKTTRLIKFIVIDKSAIYNVILGTPWLQSMKAVPSTYHQCLKFPTTFEVKTIRRSQEMSRLCFAAKHKLRFKSMIPTKACLAILPTTQVDLPSQEGPKRELIVQVKIDKSDPK